MEAAQAPVSDDMASHGGNLSLLCQFFLCTNNAALRRLGEKGYKFIMCC